MKKNLLLIFFFINILSVKSQNDTLILPSAEVTSLRINRFAVGQVRLQSDSTTLSLYRTLRLSDYLNAETPLSIKSFGTGVATVLGRGMGASHTAVVWNGINLQNPINGIVDLNLVNIGTTQQVSVQMGGSSSLFGSGAIAGALYLNNDLPQKIGFQGNISYGNGSFGLQQWQGQAIFRAEKGGISLRVAHQKAANNFIFRNTAEIGQPMQTMPNAAYENLNISSSILLKPTHQDIIKINFWHTINFRQIMPSMVARTDHAFFRDTANRIVGEWTHFFKNKLKKSFLRHRIAHIKDNNFYESDVVKNSQNGISSTVVESEWNYDFSNHHALRVGANWTLDISNNNNYAENHRRNRIALFINDALQTKFFRLTANLRQEYLRELLPTTFSLGLEKEVLPLILKQFSNKKHTENSLLLRGSFSRNYNVPTFNDLYWLRLGVPTLQAEQGWSKELGITFSKKNGQLHATTHLTFFDIRMNNRIVWLPQIDGIFRPTNLNKLVSQGIEYLQSVQYNFKNKSILKLSANYQYTKADDKNGGVSLFIPTHRGAISMWWTYRNLFYMAWQQTASSRRYSATDKSVWTQPFTLADATIGATPSVGKITFDVRLQISNLFNQDYETIRFFANPKRQYKIESIIFF